MARIRRLPPPPSVPAAYGAILAAAQKELGLTDRELARLAGRKGDKKDQTMYRLRRGQGSVKSALDVRQALVARGANVPPLPLRGIEPEPEPQPQPERRLETRVGDHATPAPTVQGTQQEPWRELWISLGKRIHDNATEEQFRKCVGDLSKLADALEKVATLIGRI